MEAKDTVTNHFETADRQAEIYFKAGVENVARFLKEEGYYGKLFDSDSITGAYLKDDNEFLICKGKLWKAFLKDNGLGGEVKMDLRKQISSLLWKPPTTGYASSSGGSYIDIDREALVDQILKLVIDAGYVKLADDQSLPKLDERDKLAALIEARDQRIAELEAILLGYFEELLKLKQQVVDEREKVLKEVFGVVDGMLGGMGLGRDNFKRSDWEDYQKLRKELEVKP